MKNMDSQQIALYLRSLPYGVLVAFLIFAPAVLVAHVSIGHALLLAGGGFFAAWLIPPILSERTARIGAAIYSASGSSTPSIRQYSLADSLVARGKYDEAAEAYTLLSEDFPTDPEPRVRLARLYRDQLQRPDNAAESFKRALAVPNIEAATEIAVARELIEVYTHKLRTPARALPYLARLAEKHPSHPVAEWARSQYRDIKAAMQQEILDG